MIIQKNGILKADLNLKCCHKIITETVVPPTPHNAPPKQDDKNSSKHDQSGSNNDLPPPKNPFQIPPAPGNLNKTTNSSNTKNQGS